MKKWTNRFWNILIPAVAYSALGILLMREINNLGSNTVLTPEHSYIEFGLITLSIWLFIHIICDAINAWANAWRITQYDDALKPSAAFADALKSAISGTPSDPFSKRLAKVEEMAAHRKEYNGFIDRVIWWGDNIGMLALIALMVTAGYIWTSVYFTLATLFIIACDNIIWNSRKAAAGRLVAREQKEVVDVLVAEVDRKRETALQTAQ